MANAHGHGGGHGGGDHPSVEILSQMGYESRDISLPALVKSLFVFMVFLVFMLAIPYLLYKAIIPTWADQLNQPMRHQRRVPPFPQIQPQPKPDMMAYRTAEDRVLNGQAAMPNEKPAMPVNQAIDILSIGTGLSGIKGDDRVDLDPSSHSYPGGGDYGTPGDATAPPATTPGGTPPAPIEQGAATNPVLKTGAGVGNTAGGKPGVGAPGHVAGSPMPGAPDQAAPTPETETKP